LGDFVLEIMALPIPWFQLDNEGEAMVDLFVAGAVPDDPSSREHLGSVIIGDRRMAGFFGYLTAGDLPRAAILAREAKELLFYKYENPLAAAAGAYVLLSQIREEEEFERQSWHGWVDNLMRRFPWIPDGAIQFGWLKLRQGAEREAREAFLEAFDRGLPFYSLGLRWLLDGFTVVGHADPDGREDATVMEASKKVRKVALHTDMSQPFTSVRLGVLSGS
jgi:hypothetical protein